MIDSALVDVNWLVEHLQDAELVILEASVQPVVPGFESINSKKISRLFLVPVASITTRKFVSQTAAFPI